MAEIAIASSRSTLRGRGPHACAVSMRENREIPGSSAVVDPADRVGKERLRGSGLRTGNLGRRCPIRCPERAPTQEVGSIRRLSGQASKAGFRKQGTRGGRRCNP
jgi:hypothetical protein